MSVWNPKQSKILASFFGVVTRTLPPSSLLREKTRVLFFQRNPTLRTRPTPRRTNERTNERTRDDEKRATFLSSRAKWAATRVGFLRVSSRLVVACCFLFLFLRERELEMPKRLSSVFVPLLFSREKTSADQRNRNARIEVGEKMMMRPKRAARKKNKVSSRTLSFERIRCAQSFEGVFCARKVSSSSGKRARASGGKSIVGRLFPLTRTKKKEKKISYKVVFLPLFCPFFGALFFIASLFFFRSRFPLFWREGKSFPEFRVLVFPI